MAFNVDLSLPADFDNIVKLFPLPNVVLLPGVMQGLHIFEPRYRQLMDDALVSDQLITMAVVNSPNRGLAEKLDDCPAVYPTVCIGKIVTHSRADDGRYNLLLAGARRARIIREVATEKAYRVAEVELLKDVLDVSEAEIETLRQTLINEFMKFATQRQGMSEDTIKNMLVDSMPFGLLVDLVCYSIGLETEDQLKILQAQNISRRCGLVLKMLEHKQVALNESNSPDAKPGRDFPPDFSIN